MSSLKYILEQPSSVMLFLQENSTLTDTKPKLDTANDIHEKSATLNSHTKASTPEVHSSSATREKSSLKDSQSKPTISSAGLSSHHALVFTACQEEEQEKNMTIEEIIELGDDCLGLRIILTSREGTYMGVINHVLLACRRLALEKVCNPKTGKKRLGMLTVFFHNILNISVVGEDREARQRLLKDVYREVWDGRQLLMKKYVPIHLNAFDEMYNEVDDDVLLGRAEQKPLPLNENISKDIQEEPPPPARIPRPAKWVVIDTLDDAFKKALTFISAENVIAMGMEGLKLGRSGTLAWLSVATSTMIFLFDMANMGASQAFQEGLGDIIQDSAILKVVHDCRAMEDILHHQFQINFSSIFDTQAADVYVYMLNHQWAVPSFVSSLPSLLIRHLHLSPHHVFFPHVRQECSQDDESVWFERPLSPHLCEGMARNIKFLRELRLVFLDFILVDLAQVTNLFQGALRDKDSSTANRLERHIVPAEVQRLGRRSVINSVGVHDPYIYYYRNSYKLATKRK
ncbi:piRNA biogenesis protein EXD1-like isoform X1 [Homarus americanus]|uniref:piRNA biogenesis protein EXD1-like isoform X1 n=1 Tax=Homarus americanus TaxID=6706 RepID=UPI001C4505A2|nr:piRNA biogenesis protein EXD1-like isoform X1 [Homarus americanus]